MQTTFNMPTEKDYHKTKVIDLLHGENPGFNGYPKEMIGYRDIVINKRVITDYQKYEIKMTVLDDDKEKVKAFETAKEKWCDENQVMYDEFDAMTNSINSFPHAIYPGGKIKPMLKPHNEMMMGMHKTPQFLSEPPVHPTRELRLPATVVMYFTGVQRMIVDDFDEFHEMYQDYLKLNKITE